MSQTTTESKRVESEPMVVHALQPELDFASPPSPSKLRTFVALASILGPMGVVMMTLLEERFYPTLLNPETQDKIIEGSMVGGILIFLATIAYQLMLDQKLEQQIHRGEHIIIDAPGNHHD